VQLRRRCAFRSPPLARRGRDAGAAEKAAYAAACRGLGLGGMGSFLLHLPLGIRENGAEAQAQAQALSSGASVAATLSICGP
jgi:hypothetical protein